MSESLNLETLTIAQARASVVSGSVTASTLAAQHYDRIAAVDPQINSFLALTRDRAILQAARVDAAVKSGDTSTLGPLAGVPIGIKDVLVMQGAPSTAGVSLRSKRTFPFAGTTSFGAGVTG